MLELAQVIDAQIEAGTPRVTVESALDAVGVEHSFVPAEALARFSVPAEAPGYFDTIAGRIHAVAHSDETQGSARESLTVEIDIDHDGRVARIRMAPVVTAP